MMWEIPLDFLTLLGAVCMVKSVLLQNCSVQSFL